MLLFAHPVTAARERAGRPSANAVWLSAGGTRPPRPVPAPTIVTFAGDDLAAALAAHVGAEAQPLPAHLDTVQPLWTLYDVATSPRYRHWRLEHLPANW